MQFATLVRTEHLNAHGYLFGGYMMCWVDEYSYIAAIRDYPHAHFVTRAIEAASFKKSVHLGSILIFDVTRSHVGTTSVTYEVNVNAREIPVGIAYPVFSTKITMCNVGEDGQKKPL